MYATLTGKLLSARSVKDDRGETIFAEIVQTREGFGSEVVSVYGPRADVEGLLDIPEMEDVTLDVRAYAKNGNGPAKLVVRAFAADIGRPTGKKS